MGNTLLAASFFLLIIIVDGVQVSHYAFLNKKFLILSIKNDKRNFINNQSCRILMNVSFLTRGKIIRIDNIKRFDESRLIKLKIKINGDCN